MPTLHWIGKDKVINHHLDVPYRVLDHQYGFDNGVQSTEETQSGNKIIHGDNLAALKSLLPVYEGKINCIYIDPPYNTGNEEWKYNDNVNDPKIKKWLNEVVGKEGEDLSRHDKWLCMMYPRLKLLQKLLSKDGRMVISIGYQEVFNLMPILKEIFSSAQITCATIQTSGGKPSGSFNYQHEYLIFIVPLDFEANPMTFTGGKARSPFEGLTLATFDKTQRPNQTYPIFVDTVTNNLCGIGESLQEKVKSGAYKGALKDYVYESDSIPNGAVAVWPITSKGKECVWRLSPSRLLSDWEKGFIKITPNKQKGSSNKYSIQYLPEGVIKKIKSGTLAIKGKENNSPTLIIGANETVGNDIPTIWLEKEFYSVKGTALLAEINIPEKFNYPKPLSLITEILRALTRSDDIVLDSFAGSGTTGHAILDLNKEDEGRRNFILIEMEEYAQTITAARIEKVIEGYGDIDGIDDSFNFYKLGESIFSENDQLNESIGINKLRNYIYYTETKQPLNQSAILENEYFLDIYNQTSYYFYYKSGVTTALDDFFLSTIKIKTEQYVIYADNCLLNADFMKKHNIIFKKIPRDITKF